MATQNLGPFHAPHSATPSGVLGTNTRRYLACEQSPIRCPSYCAITKTCACETREEAILRCTHRFVSLYVLGHGILTLELHTWYWPLVRGIHRSPVNFPHKGQWRGALMLSWICAWINGWVNNREASDLRCHSAHYNVTVMYTVDWIRSYHMYSGLNAIVWHRGIHPTFKMMQGNFAWEILFPP